MLRIERYGKGKYWALYDGQEPEPWVGPAGGTRGDSGAGMTPAGTA